MMMMKRQSILLSQQKNPYITIKVGNLDKQFLAKIFFYLILDRRINRGYRHDPVNGEHSLQPDGDHCNTREGIPAF